MFVRDKSLSRLDVTRDIVDLYRSINSARVAPEGAESQPCDACVISMKSGVGVPSVYVVLFLTVNRVRQVYVPELQPSTMFEYERSLQEALDFVESIGFMIDSIEVGDDPQRSVEIIKSIPALYIPGIDPSPGSSHDLSSLFEAGESTRLISPQAPSAVIDAQGGSSPAAVASRPSDLLSRLRSLVQAESDQVAMGETGFGDFEASGELILDDISLFEGVEDQPVVDGVGKAPAAPELPGDELESLDGIALFEDYSPLDSIDACEEMTFVLPRQSASTANPVSDDSPFDAVCLADDATAFVEPPSESVIESDETTCEGARLSDDDELQFAVFAASFDGQIESEEPVVVDEQPDARGESEAVAAEVVVEIDRPTGPHTTDLSRLAAGSILEQIGKLLGSL